MKSNNAWRILIVLCLGIIAGGCASSTPFSKTSTPGAPVVIHMPGIGGPSPMDRSWLEALREGGLDADIEMFDWTGDDPGIGSLQDLARNQAEAVKLADLLTNLAHSQPRHPIILSCNSAGVGVGVWALERLPDDVDVQAMILTAPAISPDYDLTRALRHVRGRCLAFTSTGDAFVCGFGTSVFGTIDRVNTDAAGRVGFSQPVSAETAQYAKLKVFTYRAEWTKWGDYGGHVGSMTAPFARNVIAPLLIAEVGKTTTARQATPSSSLLQ